MTAGMPSKWAFMVADMSSEVVHIPADRSVVEMILAAATVIVILCWGAVVLYDKHNAVE